MKLTLSHYHSAGSRLHVGVSLMQNARKELELVGDDGERPLKFNVDRRWPQSRSQVGFSISRGRRLFNGDAASRTAPVARSTSPSTGSHATNFNGAAASLGKRNGRFAIVRGRSLAADGSASTRFSKGPFTPIRLN